MCAASLSLDERLAEALGLLRRVAADHTQVAVAWTGGKDSTVALWLWLQVLRELGQGPARVLNLDTGCKFPEILAFRDDLAARWGLEMTVVRPAVDIAGYPLAQDPMACCRELKIEPLRHAVASLGLDALISGIRRDEHPSRAGRQALEQRHDPDHLLVNPVLELSELDIWSVIMGQGLPYCALYDQGYRSLGCRPCTAAPGAADPATGQGEERAGRDGRKEAMLAQLTSLGYF